MAKDIEQQQSVVNPWELDWHNANVKQDSQSFGRKAKDLGKFGVDRTRDLVGIVGKGAVSLGQAAKGVYDFADEMTGNRLGAVVNPVGTIAKGFGLGQKVDNWVDNSDSFMADLARNAGFGDKTQDAKGFGNKIQQNITDYVQSDGMREALAKQAQANEIERQRWENLSDDEKGFGARLGHWGQYAKNTATNPLAVMDTAGTSAVEMVGGGKLLKGVHFGLKGLQGTKAGAKALGVVGGENAAKAAITEGLIAGGHAVKDTKDEMGDDFDRKAALKAGLTAGATGVIALGGNRLGRALGIADVDELLVAGARNTAKGTGGKLGRLGAVAKGAVQEGLLEELPQGMAESALQNWAMGKDITDGMAENAIQGAISGGLMGGGGAGIHYQKAPDKGFGFRPASKVTAKDRKKYADSIEEQQQAAAERIYGGSTELGSENALNQQVNYQTTQGGFDLGKGGQKAVDLSAMRQNITPSAQLGLRKTEQGGGALENTAALAVDNQLAVSSEQLAVNLGSLNNQVVTNRNQLNNQIADSSKTINHIADSGKMVNADENNQTITNSNALKQPIQYTPQEIETIRRIESTPQKGREMEIIGRDNFTVGILDYAVENNRKVAVDTLSEEKAQELGYKYPKQVRRTIGASEINHTLQRHGSGSQLVRKSGQRPVTKQDIAKWTQYADKADLTVKTKDDLNQEVIISGKQINGYYAVVESVRKKNNELAFKTMYFEKGNLNNHPEFKNAPAVTQGQSVGRKTDSVNANGSYPSGYEPVVKLDLHSPTVDKTISQSTKNASGKSTATQNKPLINQGVSASENSVKPSVKQSPRLKANLRRQFNSVDNRVEMERQKVVNTPELAKKAKEQAQQNIIAVNAKTKEQAQQKAIIFGWTETHSPKKEIISGKWQLVKNDYWNSKKSNRQKEDTLIADAVKNVQAATKKISNEQLAVSNEQVKQTKTKTALAPVENATTTQAVASSSAPIAQSEKGVNLAGQTVPTEFKKSASEMADYFAQQALAEKLTNNYNEISSNKELQDKIANEHALLQAEINQLKDKEQLTSKEKSKLKTLETKSKKLFDKYEKLNNRTNDLRLENQKIRAKLEKTDTEKPSIQAAENNPLKASEEHLAEVSKALTPDDEMKRRFVVMDMRNRMEMPNTEFATRQDAKERLEFHGWENEFKIVKKGNIYKVVDMVKPYGNLQYGKRQGLEKLPDIPVVRLNGNEFNAETMADMRKLADEFLRVLQTSKAKLHNDEQNWDLSINRSDRKKMGDNENLPKHTTQAVAGIRDLAKNAVLVESHEDAKHSNPDVIAIHRLYAPVLIGDTLYRAKLTVKDYVLNNDTQRKQLHAIETVEIEKETAGLGTLPSLGQNPKTAQPTTLRDKISISELLQNAKSDIDGKPLIEVKKQLQKQAKQVKSTPSKATDSTDLQTARNELSSAWADYANRDNLSVAEKQALKEKIIHLSNEVAHLATKDNYPKVKLPYAVNDGYGVHTDNLKKAKIALSSKSPMTKRRLAIRHLAQSELDIRQDKLLEEHIKVNLLIDDVINLMQNGEIETPAELSNFIQDALQKDGVKEKYALNKPQEKVSGSLNSAKSVSSTQNKALKAKAFDPASVKPATDTQIKNAVVTPKRPATNSEQAKEQAQAFLRQEQINKHSGLPAMVHSSNLKKMLSNSAFVKSVNRELHALAVANVDELYQNAIYGWRKPDRDNSPDIAGIHRLFATLHTEQGDYVVKLTVKEYTQPEQNNGLYTVETLSVQENAPAYNSVKQLLEHDKIGGNYSTNTTGDIESLIKNAQEVNAKNSKSSVSDKTDSHSKTAENEQQKRLSAAQTMYSKADEIRQRKQSAEHKQAVVSSIIQAVGEKNAGHIQVMSWADAQKHSPELLSLGNNAVVEAYATDDGIIFVADAFDKPELAGFVAWHELGHRGIGVKGRKAYHALLNELRGNVVLSALAYKFYQRYANSVQGFTRQDALEEAIVELYAAYKTGDWATLEKRNNIKIPAAFKDATQKHGIARIWAKIKAFVRALFGNKQVSDDQVIALLRGLDKVQGYEFNPKTHDLKAVKDRNRFSISADTRQAYNARIDALFNGEKASATQGVKVLDRSDMLDMLGYGNKAVHLAESKVIQGMTKHPLITADLWKKIPDWIENPAMVFHSDTVDNRLVFIAPETVKGQHIRIVIEPDGVNGLNAHLLLNTYNTDNKSPYVRWVKDRLMLYAANKEIVGRINGQLGLRLSDILRNPSFMPYALIHSKGQGNIKPTAQHKKILTEKNLNGYRKNELAKVSVDKNQAKTRFSLAQNNRAIADINARTVKNLTEETDFEMLQDNFADNWEDGEIRPQHKQLFDNAKKSKTVSAFKAAMAKIKNALRFNEIPHGQEELRAFAGYFELIEDKADLKPYSKEDLKAIANNRNFQEWQKNAHKFFKNADGTPKVFYRGMTDIDSSDIGSLKTNASENEYGAEFYTSSAIQAETYFNEDGYIQQVALNAQNPFVVPHTKGKNFNNLLNGYRVSQAVRLFKLAGFDTKPANWGSLKVFSNNIAKGKDTVTFYLQDSEKTGYELTVDKKPDDFAYRYERNGYIPMLTEILAVDFFSTNFFVRNLQQRGKFDSVIFKDIEDTGWQYTGENGSRPLGDVVAVWGTTDNQAYAKELGNKGTFSKEDKRIFFSLKQAEDENTASLEEMSKAFNQTPQEKAQAEFTATAKKYGGEKAYNKAKADGKTELTYKQWVQVRTPSFKAWFGDWENDPTNASKVVNPDTGEPQVMYRGSPEQLGYVFEHGKNFYGGNRGFWFAAAKSVAKDYAFNQITGDFGEIKEVFLRIKEPLDFTKMGKKFITTREFYSFLEQEHGIYLGNSGSSKQTTLREMYHKHQKELYNLAYDGYIIFDHSHWSFVAKRPNQIKSATDNIGTFDRQNPDIRYSLKADNQPTIKEQIRENAAKLDAMPSVVSVTGTAKNITALRQEVLQHLKDTGGFVVDIPNFGQVELGEKEIKQSLKYDLSDAEQVAYKAIKAVLKRGLQITSRDNHKGRDYPTTTFAAPIEINGKRALMAVVVKQTGKNHYKMHRVLTSNGEVFRLSLKANGSVGVTPDRIVTDNAVHHQTVKTSRIAPTHDSTNAVTDNVANSMPTVKQLSGSLKAIKEVAGQDTYDLIATMIRAENTLSEDDDISPKLRYSIATTAEKARQAFGAELGKIAKATYGKIKTPLMKTKKTDKYPSGWRVYFGNKWKDSLNVQLQFLGRRHIVDIFDRVFKGRLKAYSDLVADMDAMKNSLSQKHDDLVRDWGKLPAEENDKLVAVMHKATLAQYDPDTKDGKINYQANWNNKVVKNIDEIKALHRDFARLSPDAKRIYRQVRDNYKEHYNRVRVAMEERIVRMLDGVPDTQKDPFGMNIGKKEIIEKMNNHFDKGLSGVYFPLQRFGDYVVVAKDKSGKTISVGRAETANQAEEVRREYLRDFPKADGYTVLPVQLSKDYVQSKDGAGRAFIQNLIGEFANRPDLLDGDQFDEVADIVEQMWLASMPDLSWAKHGIHRKGMAGFSEKARRAYAQNMIHGTNYLARLTYSDQLGSALDEMQAFIDNNANNEEFNHIVAQRVQNEMEKRHENLMRPNSHPLATKLTGLGFVWYLGLSPASAIVNLTQTWLVGLPVIGAKYGIIQTAKMLAKASGQTLKGAKKDGFTFDISGSLNTDEKAAFDRAVKDGTIDTSQAYDLAGIADGHEDAVYFKYQRFMRGVAKMFHEAEVFNRQATFIAVYRLARQKGMTSEAAYQEAKDLTYKSHFDYATSNRARVLQGNWQRVIFLFKQFGFNMLYTVYRNAYVGFLTGIAGTKQHYTAEERKQARKAVLAMGVSHFAVAGVLGLPLVGTVLSVMTAIAHAGGADDDWDAEEEMKKAFASVLGKKGGNAVSYGLTRYLGVDLHGRLGLHDMIFPDVQENLEGQDWAERFTVGMSGAVVGMFVNFAKGLNQVHNGEVLKGAESMLPTAVRNGIKSYRLATQGQVDRTGVVVKDDFNAAEITTTAIGFNPASLRRAMEGKSAVMSVERKKNAQRSALVSAYAKAYMDGDTKAMGKIAKEISEWNSKNPTRKITPTSLNQSIKNRRRRIDNAKHGVYLSDSHQDAYDDADYAIMD